MFHWYPLAVCPPLNRNWGGVKGSWAEGRWGCEGLGGEEGGVTAVRLYNKINKNIYLKKFKRKTKKFHKILRIIIKSWMERSDSMRNGLCKNDLIFRKWRRNIPSKRDIDAERKRERDTQTDIKRLYEIQKRTGLCLQCYQNLNPQRKL